MNLNKTILFCLAVMCAVLIGCDKAPRGIIKESKMAKLIVDLDKADAYIAINPNEFPNDSAKMVLKESVFAKYGVTAADYDSSLVWYAHNVETYNRVYDKAIKELEKQRNNLDKKVKKAEASGLENAAFGNNSFHKPYSSKGDTADVWDGLRKMMLTSNLGCGYYAFDANPDADSRKGDKYTLNCKILGSFNPKVSFILAADYSDGTTSLKNYSPSASGWMQVSLQCDSAKDVHRIYGYMKYNVSPYSVAFVDSIQLLRTHLDVKTYNAISAQRIVNRR